MAGPTTPPASAVETVPEEDGEKFDCRECGSLPRTAFHSSSLKRAIHYCKRCIKIKNQKYFKRAKESTIQEWRIRQRVSGKFQLGRKELADIFAAYGGRMCFVTSLENVPLTLIRADPARDYTVDNAVPVMARIASALDHLPDESLARWRKRFGAVAADPAALPLAKQPPQQPSTPSAEAKEQPAVHPEQQKQPVALQLATSAVEAKEQPTAEQEQEEEEEEQEQEPAEPTAAALLLDQQPTQQPCVLASQPSGP